MPSVSIIIIHYNSDEYLEACLECIQEQTFTDFETIVIDNASKNNLSELVIKFGSNYRYIRSNENLGSTKANNLGISLTKSPFMLILNADVFLKPNFIEECMKAFVAEDVAAVSGKLINNYHKNLIDTVGIQLTYEGTVDEMGQGERVENFSSDEYVFGVCCAAAMYRREILSDERECLFDENIFAFQEEFELSLYLLSRNLKSYYCASAEAFHVRGGSTDNLSEFVKRQNIINSYYVYKKYLENCSLLLPKIFYLFRCIRFWDLLRKVNTHPIYLSPTARKKLLASRSYSYIAYRCKRFFLN